MNQRNLYIISNEKKVALIEFPKAFDIPEKRVVNNVTYYKTNRVRKTKNYEAIIYTEMPCTLDLDEFSIPLEESAIEKDLPKTSPNTQTTKQSALETVIDPDKPSYYAVRCAGQFSTGANSSSLPTPRLYLSAKNAKKAAKQIPLYKSEGFEIVKFVEVEVTEKVRGTDE